MCIRDSLWTLWPEGESEFLTSSPRSDFMAQSLVFSIDVCRRPEISPLRSTFGWVFLRPILAQKLPRNYYFLFLFETLQVFSWRFVPIASGTEILQRASLKFKLFLVTSRFHCHRFNTRPTVMTKKKITSIQHSYKEKDAAPHSPTKARKLTTVTNILLP